MSGICPSLTRTPAPPAGHQVVGSGVSMPSRLAEVAAQIATATLPCAIEVKAMDDWTVEDSRVGYSTPVAGRGGSTLSGSGRAASPSSGNGR
ncbi:hypothetical protein GCM10010430_40670 [Kitasatospora cystarginea]|uniref:Uncharacterized protein n=1 Tax=Kitasatospora cystarginea TaxID=58350 RepID=A0ABN3EB52_9ACTN